MRLFESIMKLSKFSVEEKMRYGSKIDWQVPIILLIFVQNFLIFITHSLTFAQWYYTVKKIQMPTNVKSLDSQRLFDSLPSLRRRCPIFHNNWMQMLHTFLFSLSLFVILYIYSTKMFYRIWRLSLNFLHIYDCKC